MESIIEQICYMGRAAPENQIDEVKISRITGGLSNSVVTRIKIAGRDHTMDVPAIVKFSERSAAQREIANHAKYVRWTLPYTWRVDVLGTGETGQFAAVAYSFAHGGAAEPISLYRLIRDGDLKTVTEVVGKVFDPKSKTWYSNIRNSNPDLALYLSADSFYFADTGKDWEKKINRLKEQFRVCAKRYDELTLIDEGGTFICEVGSARFNLSDIMNSVFTVNWGLEATECICHGDMNAENILVKSGTSDFSFIDFQATGWHHRARDFCALENSVRAGYPADGSFSESLRSWLELERAWLRDNRDRSTTIAEVTDGRSLIAYIRTLFLANFGEDHYLELIFANLIHQWWLANKRIWSPTQHDRFLASFLATYEFLMEERRRIEMTGCV